MDTFYAENKNTLERFEWDDMWWDNSNPNADLHILIIGDSISRSYRYAIKRASGEGWCIDNFATSKAVDNPNFVKALDLAISQQENYDLILFNNGLHGWHLTSEEYGKNYKEMLKQLHSRNKNLAVLLTSPWLDPRNNLVIERNEYAKAAAEELGLKVIDVYSCLENKENLYSTDKIHLNPEGVQTLTEFIYESIKELLKK